MEKQQHQQRGGVLYITDPPPTLDFGIDCMHYETGAKFRGVSMVPQGLHFVYHSTGMGSRQGFFLYFEKDAVVVKSWDTKNEDISAKLLLPEAALQSLLQSIHCGQEDQFLGPYPLQQHSSWLNLSNYMTASTLQRAGLDFHTPVYPGDAEDIPAELLSEQNEQALTSYFPDQARIAQFCDIQLLKKNLREAITTSTSLNSSSKAQELSQLHLDSSTLLDSVVTQYFDNNWEELLAEVQLSFMLFMLIFSFPALQQWKALVNLICKSERALVAQPNFTSCFIRLFYEQLQYSPDDFFETEISSDNFLKPALSHLFEALDSRPLPASLDAMRKRLFAFVQKKFNVYVDGGEERSDIGGVSLHMCEGTKFNLVEEDMPVVVMPEDLFPSAARAPVKGVSFAPGCGVQQDSEAVKCKWNKIDEALGISMQEEPASDRMQLSSKHVLPPPVINKCDDPAENESDSGVGESVKSSLSLQSSLFSWRYPLLFDEMSRNNTSKSSNSLAKPSNQSGQEDLTMTAMRVLETAPPQLEPKATSLSDGEAKPSSTNVVQSKEADPLQAEALRFVKDEISLW